MPLYEADGKKQKPIMGIHIGSLGFLSECVETNLEKNINYILENKFSISKRILLNITIDLNGKKQNFLAMNDFVVDHGPSGRILKTEVHVSNEYVPIAEFLIPVVHSFNAWNPKASISFPIYFSAA